MAIGRGLVRPAAAIAALVFVHLTSVLPPSAASPADEHLPPGMAAQLLPEDHRPKGESPKLLTSRKFLPFSPGNTPSLPPPAPFLPTLAPLIPNLPLPPLATRPPASLLPLPNLPLPPLIIPNFPLPALSPPSRSPLGIPGFQAPPVAVP